MNKDGLVNKNIIKLAVKLCEANRTCDKCPYLKQANNNITNSCSICTILDSSNYLEFREIVSEVFI